MSDQQYEESEFEPRKNKYSKSKKKKTEKKRTFFQELVSTILYTIVFDRFIYLYPDVFICSG